MVRILILGRVVSGVESLGLDQQRLFIVRGVKWVSRSKIDSSSDRVVTLKSIFAPSL
jgi:hypothetical protein